MAVGPYEPVVGASEACQARGPRPRPRAPSRPSRRWRTNRRSAQSSEILKEALAKAGRKRTDVAADVAAEGRLPMSRVAEVLEVSRSQLHARASGVSKLRGAYKAADAELLPEIRRLVDQRPTHGYRRIAALLNRERRIAGLEPINRKRVLRILGRHGLTLERSTGRRESPTHDGRVAVMASNLRWCSDAFEIGCWNGGRVRFGAGHGPLDRAPVAPHPSSSTPSTARSSPTLPSQAPASPARTSAT